MSRCLIAGLVLVSLITSAVAADETRVVWQIGRADNDYRDLAHLTNLADFGKTFPDGVKFTVGKSDPAKDFPFIHPGPADAWAGKREHPFTINFELAAVPDDGCELRVDLVDAHADAPPRLIVEINGQRGEVALTPGTGDPTLIRPEKGKNRTLRFFCNTSVLKQGANKITITATRGSWFLYDAITLARLPKEVASALELAVTPSIFFVERDGRLLQEFNCYVAGVLSSEPVVIEVRTGDGLLSSGRLAQASLGTLSGQVLIPPAESTRSLVIRAICGKQTAVVTVDQKPQRKWHIFCAPSTHTDIGYTDLQENVIALHNRNTDLALQLIQEFPLYHWNLESSWAAQMWFRDRPQWRHKELYEASKNRRVGIEAGYLNMLTGLCSEEELVRNLYYSARLHRQHGVPFESFTLTDAPSHVWSIPTILAGAGIRYVSVGINGIRAPLLKQNLHHKSPFWWEARDGSKVLTWFTPGYSQAGQIGLNEGPERMRAAIEKDLYWWDHREDYPFDAILLHGAYSDNVAIGRAIAESLTEYSKRYAYPKVILCANNHFFEHIEKNFADKIPTVRGCGGSWWEDGAASSAFETAVNRVAHQDAVAAEAIWAAGGKDKATTGAQSAFNRVWDNILLYDEHTWGAWNSISAPTSDFVTRQFAVKAAYATDAARQIRQLMSRGLNRLAARVNVPAGSLLVFNPSGSVRTGVVHAEIPRHMLVMDEDGPLPQQVVKEDVLENVTVALLARDVPPVGYRTYRVAKDTGKLANPPARFRDNVLENDFYRVTLDPKTAAVASIFDKMLKKELVDQSSKYKLGQVIYGVGGDFTGEKEWWGPDPAKIVFNELTGKSIEAGARGPLFSSAKCKAEMKGFRSVELETILYEQERRIQFVVRLNKEMTFDREALYVAFPFAGANPRFRYEIGGGHVKPNDEHLPGGCRDWFAVQRWVTVHTDDAAVIWSPVDTPLITLCDLTPGKWLDTLPITNGTIFAYCLNNYWFTNYKAGQDGNFTFRFDLTSDKSFDPQSACVFGEAAVQPMRSIRLHPGRGKKGLPASASFCQVGPANIMLTAFKDADDGRGVIIRLRETAGKDTTAVVKTVLPDAQKAVLCDLVERDQGPAEFSNGQLKVPVKADSMAAVRIE